eukprot:scaffold41078_cov64-Phaeocystis_antarctica.AAC.3
MEVIALDSDGGGGEGGSGSGANQESHAAGMTQKVALPELEQSNGEQNSTVKRSPLFGGGGERGEAAAKWSGSPGSDAPPRAGRPRRRHRSQGGVRKRTGPLRLRVLKRSSSLTTSARHAALAAGTASSWLHDVLPFPRGGAPCGAGGAAECG